MQGGGLASIIAKAMGRGPDLTAAESGEGVASFEVEKALGLNMDLQEQEYRSIRMCTQISISIYLPRRAEFLIS